MPPLAASTAPELHRQWGDEFDTYDLDRTNLMPVPASCCAWANAVSRWPPSTSPNSWLPAAFFVSRIARTKSTASFSAAAASFRSAISPKNLSASALPPRRFYLIATRRHGKTLDWIALPVSGECELDHRRPHARRALRFSSRGRVALARRRSDRGPQSGRAHARNGRGCIPVTTTAHRRRHTHDRARANPRKFC